MHLGSRFLTRIFNVMVQKYLIFRSKQSKYYILLGIVNDIPKVTLNLQ